jgi:ketosteroid isomerase-like protein
VSQRNVELVRASFEAFGRGDFDAAFAEYDRDGRIVRVEEYRTVEEALDAVDRPQT